MLGIEKKEFYVHASGQEREVTFQFQLIPNDMKYVAFLSGELSISAKFFPHLLMLVRMIFQIFHHPIGGDLGNMKKDCLLQMQ